MDVMTMRFICIFLIIAIGMLVIPIGFFMYCHKRYDNRMQWWILPTFLVYLFIFFMYAKNLIPDDWQLRPVEMYQCAWETKYIPKS